METRPHRIVSLIWASLFAIIAIYQATQDLHPIWLAAYALMIVLMLRSIVRRLPIIACILPMVAALLAAVLIWPDEFQGNLDPWGVSNVVYIRQSIFLIFCAVGCGYLSYRSKRRIKRRM